MLHACLVLINCMFVVDVIKSNHAFCQKFSCSFLIMLLKNAKVCWKVFKYPVVVTKFKGKKKGKEKEL